MRLREIRNFDFLTLRHQTAERELEEGLLAHIRKFLIELGAGFAFVGQQVHLSVDGDDFYLAAVDDQLRHPDDELTIGLILCKTRSKVVAEHALPKYEDTNGCGAIHHEDPRITSDRTQACIAQLRGDRGGIQIGLFHREVTCRTRKPLAAPKGDSSPQWDKSRGNSAFM